jgi:hypothetical protein
LTENDSRICIAAREPRSLALALPKKALRTATVARELSGIDVALWVQESHPRHQDQEGGTP